MRIDRTRQRKAALPGAPEAKALVVVLVADKDDGRIALLAADADRPLHQLERDAVAAARPTHVIHQLTALPKGGVRRSSDLAATNRLRIDGTRNLIDAAVDAGARRLIVGSFAPMQGLLDADGDVRDGVAAVQSLESQTIEASRAGRLEGIVLRYGRFYGLGTWTAEPKGPGPLHVDAAAQAAMLALARGKPGVYNVAEDDGAVSSEKAKRELGFDASFRMRA